MNCKPGDLAICINGYAENIGTLVEVVEPYGEFHKAAWIVRPLSRGVVVVSINNPAKRPLDPSRRVACYDDCLRPIRDPGDDACDEMTRIAGKPTEEQDRLWAEFDTAMSELEKRLA